MGLECINIYRVVNVTGVDKLFNEILSVLVSDQCLNGTVQSFVSDHMKVTFGAV